MKRNSKKRARDEYQVYKDKKENIKKYSHWNIQEVKQVKSENPTAVKPGDVVFVKRNDLKRIYSKFSFWKYYHSGLKMIRKRKLEYHPKFYNLQRANNPIEQDIEKK
ncbi:hypothetical protein NPIL_530861 [Nephila pilipes]|uniref:Uncharacterized protein n=1 Tax=Nephila pilipes TaxID=299642 RepID=A0A8X6NSF8_NEPPI|nr:hypothetical protein NPIL_530861 [Nephila pilipes]